MKIGFKRVSVLLAASVFLAAGAASAAEKEVAPYLKITIPVEVQNDGNFASDIPGNRLNDLFTTTEPEITVGILKGLTFFTHVVLDPVRAASPGDSRFFSNHGLYIEEIYLQYKAYLRKSEGSALAIKIYGGKCDFFSDMLHLLKVTVCASVGLELRYCIGSSAFFVSLSRF